VTALLLDGAVGRELLVAPPAGEPVEVEHASGKLAVGIELDTTVTPPRVRRSTVFRTARKLFDGTVFPRP
jgi:4-oxalomesaconate tautomerase